MATKTKRKIISGVSLLCVLMLLIGIFPTGFSGNNTADAADSNDDVYYNNSCIYFDITSIVDNTTLSNDVKSKWNAQVYMWVKWNNSDSSAKFYAGNRIAGSSTYYWEVGGWENKENQRICFTVINDWNDLKDYYRTSIYSYLDTANRKIFSWSSPNTVTITSSTQFVLASKNIPSGQTINNKGDESQNIPITDTKPTHDPNKLYLKSTFYDYYSDYELNGKDRTDLSYTNDNRFSNTDGYGWTNTRYVQAQTFDLALSDYYESNNVANPLYFGHFQWKNNNAGTFFVNLNNGTDSNCIEDGGLKLFGASTNGTVGNINDNATYYNRVFFHNNNSEYRQGCTVKNGCADAYEDHTHATDVATQGLFNNTLVNGSLALSGGTEAPYFNESFLRGGNSQNKVLGNVYKDVDFPFVKNSDGYWEFNSADATQTVRLKQTTDGEYYLHEVGASGVIYGYTDGNIINVPNFFPLNSSSDLPELSNINWDSTLEVYNVNNPGGSKITVQSTENGTYIDRLNCAFGLTLDIPFDLGGQTVDENENDIVFEFSGDDDVVIYLDDELILDIGGSHAAVGGTINFNERTVTVTKVKTSTAETANVEKTFTELGINFNAYESHTLKMFYVERGLWESNMKVTFNMPVKTQLDVEKRVDLSNVDSEIKDAISDNVDNLDFNFGIKFATKEEPIEDYVLNDCTTLDGFDYYGADNVKNSTLSLETSYEGKSGVIKCGLDNIGSGGNYGPIFQFSETVNLEEIDYLYIWIYNERLTSANDPRITLYDSDGDALYTGTNGFTSGKGWTSGLTYNGSNNSLGNNEWKQIKISAAALINAKENSNFNINAVSKITITYWETLTLHIAEIGYHKSNSETTWTGLTAETKKYTLNSDETTTYTATSGAFTMKNKYISHFINQFDQGVALNVCEGSTFKWGSNSYGMSPIFSTGWELYRGSTREADGGGYEAAVENESKIPGTFIFLGTTDSPDKVRFINTMNTKTITIKKQLQDADGNALTAEEDMSVSFKVTFKNIAGINLEGSNTIAERTVTVTIPAGQSEGTVSISGIPVNTKYTIKETDDSSDGYEVSYDGITTEGENQLSDDITVTVTNKKPRQTGELILVKKVYKGDELSTDNDDNTERFSFVVTFAGTNIAAQTNNIKKISGEKNTGVTNITNASTDITWSSTETSITDWDTSVTNQIKATISVSANTPIKITGIPAGTTYTVTETDLADDGYKFYSMTTTDIDKTISANDNDVVTVINKKAGSLEITKVEKDNTNKVLSGAVFTLYTDQECTTVYKDTNEEAVKTTGNNGIVKFSDLPYGTYYLKETKSPSGYQISTQVITVTVDSGNITSNYVNLSGYNDNKIPNSPITMPETGGLGSDDSNNPINYVLFGAGAITLATIAFAVLNKKTKSRRRKSSSSEEVQ